MQNFANIYMTALFVADLMAIAKKEEDNLNVLVALKTCKKNIEQKNLIIKKN